jgi:pSer/pThr/pTyr-binding forkhead associated (FHA) protein
MMSSQVTLRIDDNAGTQEHTYTEPARAIVGRADNCDLRLPSDGLHADVSRHHCEFEIEPPAVRVRDLGSRNGTFVNGKLIGRRQADSATQNSDYSPTSELKHGDEVRMGHTTVRVEIFETSDQLQPMYFA